MGRRTRRRTSSQVWFRARTGGGGAVPCAWPGWLLVATMAPVLSGAGSADLGRQGGWERPALQFAVLAIYLLVISLTGGRTPLNWLAPLWNLGHAGRSFPPGGGNRKAMPRPRPISTLEGRSCSATRRSAGSRSEFMGFD